MSNTQQWLTVLLIGLATILTRFIIFWIFPPTKNPPAFIEYLGKVLPAAAIALILVYSLKDIDLTKTPFGLPEVISILVVVLMQKWRRNTLMSIVGGTITYMFLVQAIF